MTTPDKVTAMCETLRHKLAPLTEEERDEAADLIESLNAEKAELVEAAYREGWRDSENSCNGFACIQEGESWERSKARAALKAGTTENKEN